MDSKQIPGAAKVVLCAELAPSSWRRIRRALERNEDFFVLRCPAIPAEVLSLCRRMHPSVLMVHSDFVGQFRYEELLEVTAAQQTQVLVLSDDTNDATCERFIRTGCAGVLPGNASPEVYRKAVQAISAGELWAPRRILSQLARESLLANNPRRLTARETEILNLLAIGYTNQDIADHLFLSRETVRWHLRSLYSKIGASDRTSAILYARQRSESTRT